MKSQIKTSNEKNYNTVFKGLFLQLYAVQALVSNNPDSTKRYITVEKKLKRISVGNTGDNDINRGV